jgi:5'-nucleotidase
MTSFGTTRRRLATAAVGTLALISASAATPAFSTHPADTARATHDDTARQTYQRLVSDADAAKRAATDPVRLDLLAINDFHGNLDTIDPKVSSSGRINNTPAGGVAFLARHLKNLRSQAEANGASTLTVAAGDLIGASPLLSAAFHDEPTIEAMNKIGLQVASVGNHEFDEGYRELLRMQRGGCIDDGDGENNQNSCPSHEFEGADFKYLAANVKYDDDKPHDGQSIFPGYKIERVDGIKVGFIGMTLKDTPTIVTAAGVAGLKFTDEVITANRLVPKLEAKGVKSIVVLLHQGVTPSDPTNYDGCSGVTGDALDIAERLDPQIDAIVSGHTHQAYNCTVPDPAGHRRLLTSASSFGRMITDVHLLLNPKSGDVIRPAAYAVNKIVTNNLDGTDSDDTPDNNVRPVAALKALVDAYKVLVEPIAEAVIGHIDPLATPDQSVSRTPDTDGESPLGDLIADAQKADPSVVPDTGPAAGVAPVIAFMNPGGIRGDLVENAAGDITYGAAFTTQPFNNFDSSLDLTGQQILDILEQQWNGRNEGTANNKILQVSGITYTWDKSDAALIGGDDPTDPTVRAVDPASVMVDDDGDSDTPMVNLDPAATYRVTANNFLADGGDNFTLFADGTDRFVGGLDIDALANYLGDNDPYVVGPTDRITSQP